MNSEILYLQDQLSLLPEARRQLLIDAFGNRWQAGFALAGNTSGGASLALFTRLNRHGLLQDIERCQALFASPPSSCCRSKSAPVWAVLDRLELAHLCQKLEQQLQRHRQAPSKVPISDSVTG